MKVAIKKSLLVALLASNAFSAGYILPNGTILYDGSQDPTIYRVEKLSPQYQTNDETPERMDSFTPIQTNSIVIEEKEIKPRPSPVGDGARRGIQALLVLA